MFQNSNPGEEFVPSYSEICKRGIYFKDCELPTVKNGYNVTDDTLVRLMLYQYAHKDPTAGLNELSRFVQENYKPR